MSAVIGFVLGLVVGYIGAYLQHNDERRAELIPIPVYFDETPQTFYCGAASCGSGLRSVRRYVDVCLSRLISSGLRCLGRLALPRLAEWRTCKLRRSRTW